MGPKKEKNVSFKEQEKILRKLVEKHKLYEATHPAEKSEVWKKISAEFTSETGIKLRLQQIEKKWSNILQKVKKANRAIVKDVKKTGKLV